MSQVTEDARLRVVRRYDLLDTPAEGTLDRITRLAARMLGTPYAAISVVDEKRIFLKSIHGISGVREIPREPGLCSTTIESTLPGETRVISDATEDALARANSLVTGPLAIRFYAASPLANEEGMALGTLCVFGTEPRDLTELERAHLADLARVVMDELELRRVARRLLATESRLQRMQRMEAVGRLAGGVAHEFNNILMAIDTNVAFLTDEEIDDAERREILAQVRGACSRAAVVTRQLLDFAGAGQKNARVRTDAGATLKKLEGPLRSLLGGARALTINTTSSVGGTDALLPVALPVALSAEALEQVVMNLVMNARDATKSGGQISVTADRVTLLPGNLILPVAAPTELVRLSVCDDGEGMSPHVAERIFEPFFSTKDQGEGSGLGLSICHGIIKQAGGAIDVESTLGNGSTFHVYLPDANADAKKSAPETAKRPCVLVVDDDEHIRFALKRLLARDGFDVIEAGSGEAGLAIFRERADQVQMIVSDMVMPGPLSGRDLADAIKADHPNVPVLIVSGFAPALPPGYAFMNKPVDPTALRREMKKLLEPSDGPEAR